MIQATDIFVAFFCACFIKKKLRQKENKQLSDDVGYFRKEFFIYEYEKTK